MRTMMYRYVERNESTSKCLGESAGRKAKTIRKAIIIPGTRKVAQDLSPQPSMAGQGRLSSRIPSGFGHTIRRPRAWSRCHTPASRFLELDPARADSGRHVGEEIADERVWIVGDDEGMKKTGLNELLGDPVLEECDQRVEVAVHVEDADRLLMNTQRAPAQDLEELLERADPAGKGEEGRRLRRHQRLALVHAGDDMELGESVVRDLLRCEGVGDHADRPPP